MSSFLPLKHGVPQGSVLGPLFFICYINDLPSYMSPNKCSLFADDTTLVCSHTSLLELDRLSSAMEGRAQSWFSANNLLLNRQKTQKIIISSNNTVTTGNSVTLLGITIDDRLDWSSHVDVLCKKLSSIVFLLRNLKSILNLSILKNVYFALFHSKLLYGITLWGNSCHAQRVFRVQKRVIRTMLGLGYRDSCRPHFMNLCIMPLPCVFIYASLINIHDNKSTLLTHSDVHSYPTRNANCLRTNRFRLNKSKNNSLDLHLYNHLSIGLKKMDSRSFKHNIKSILTENCFYSREEFLSFQF